MVRAILKPMIRLLKYLWRAGQYPSARDFLSMGLGIEARYERCKAHWSKHLQLSKVFQRRALIGLEGARIAVLGAGRLLDLDTETLAEVAAEVDLFDADPGVLGTWNLLKRRARHNVNFHTHDITGTLANWEACLRTEVFWNERDALEILSALKLPESTLCFKEYDCIISLNIMSQLSIYWRDRANKILKRKLGQALAESPQIQKALDSNARLLEEQHINQLQESAAKELLLLSDDRFYYYKDTQSLWQEEAALQIDIPQELEGYNLTGSNSWLWHIAPQHIENVEYGEIHRVRALRWSRGGLGQDGA